MKLISNRFSIIFYCALFNLLFEYSARGLGEFFHRPLLVLSLFLIYFAYFAMLEDLIVRFRMKNYEIFLTAFIYGMFPITFLTSNLFHPSIYKGIFFLGVNWGVVFIIGILAWGVMQGIVTLYLANRLVKRDWKHARMSAVGWCVAIGYHLAIAYASLSNPVKPKGEALGYLVIGVVVLIVLGLLVKSLKSPRPSIQPFQTSKVMDFLAFGSVIIFLVLGTFLISKAKIVTSQPLNMLAVTLENYWVFLCAIIFFVYRFARKKDIVV